MLWMFAMFSPLFALSFVLGHGKGLAEKVANFSVGHFISLAMVPVYVSAALAFGLMFVGLAMNGTSNAQSTQGIVESSVAKVDNTTPGTSIFKIGSMQFTTIGILTNEDTERLGK